LVSGFQIITHTPPGGGAGASGVAVLTHPTSFASHQHGGPGGGVSARHKAAMAPFYNQVTNERAANLLIEIAFSSTARHLRQTAGAAMYGAAPESVRFQYVIIYHALPCVFARYQQSALPIGTFSWVAGCCRGMSQGASVYGGRTSMRYQALRWVYVGSYVGSYRRTVLCRGSLVPLCSIYKHILDLPIDNNTWEWLVSSKERLGAV
jgi:hypothetical protein